MTKLFAKTVLLGAIVLHGASSASAISAEDCSGWVGSVFASVKVTKTAWATISGTETCQVSGSRAPYLDIQVVLPADWSRRRFQLGGGGFDRRIFSPAALSCSASDNANCLSSDQVTTLTEMLAPLESEARTANFQAMRKMAARFVKETSVDVSERAAFSIVPGATHASGQHPATNFAEAIVVWVEDRRMSSQLTFVREVGLAFPVCPLGQSTAFEADAYLCSSN